MASLDSDEFACPLAFRPRRGEMAHRTLNFNSVGLRAEPDRHGHHARERVCLGRFYALAMAKSVLRAYHGAKP